MGRVDSLCLCESLETGRVGLGFKIKFGMGGVYNELKRISIITKQTH
jgi:hypothetical protein